LICAVFLLGYCLISCVAKGENLVLTCLCFALFSRFWLYRWLGWWWWWGQNLVWIGLDFAWFLLLFDGLVLLDLEYIIVVLDIVLVVLVWNGGIVIVVCCDCIAYVYGSPLWLYCLSWLLYLSEKRDTETIRSQP
jgi:hypothetical protein